MKNIITFKIYFNSSENIQKVFNFLFSKGGIFTPEEYSLGGDSDDDYKQFDLTVLQEKICPFIESHDFNILDFLSDNKKKYLHLTLKKDKAFELKFDITNANKFEFLQELVEFYELCVEELKPSAGFAHDLQDSKSELFGIKEKIITKIYWINIYGNDICKNINNIDEIKTLKLYSVKTFSHKGNDKIAMIRTCESPKDINSSRFSIAARDLSIILSKNKKITIQTPEKRKFDTIN